MNLLRFMLAIVIVSAGHAPIYSQEPSEKAKPVLTALEADVLALKQAELEYTQAVVNGDGNVLGRLVSDNYAAFNTKGVALKTTKNSMIQGVLSGPSKTESYEVFGLEAKVEGDAGTTSGTAYKKDRARNNLVRETTMKFTRTWVRVPGAGWQGGRVAGQEASL